MTEIGLRRLSTAIIALTAQDYLFSLRAVQKYKGMSGWRSTRYAQAEYMIADCETFFRKDLDGEYLINEIRERSWDNNFKIRMED